MTASELAHLFSLTNEYRSIRYDLRNIKALLATLGNPQDSFKSVLVAGTNGKGSVAAFLSAMMPEAGLYTSPHLSRLNERIRVGTVPISDDDLNRVFVAVKDAADRTEDLLYRPTYFEMVTAMAFLYFRDRVKFAVLEVGLGGRLDATNVVRQDVSVITSIGIDHQEYLGDTIEAIATEKAGIIKDREPVVVGPTADLSPICQRAGDRLIRATDIETKVRSVGEGLFDIICGRYHSLRPRVPGRHQIENVQIAVCTAECLGLSPAQIAHGVNTAYWPGRLERVGRFLLDGAHNVNAAAALAAFLREFHPEGVWMVFGAMADKQYEDMIKILAPHVRQFIFTKSLSVRAKDPADLHRLVPGALAEPSAAKAIADAKANAPEDATIVVCGSLYLIGEIRGVLE
jgi:dihydrofolate synthase/folylpolyglutamate synthase